MPCRHPRLATLPSGLFLRLSSFQELEQRIALLPEELQRGDAFEVFVQGYFYTQPLFQVADLWLVGQVPAEVRNALNLPRDHKGIDGVIRTRADTLVPYQVKFRVGRPSLNVGDVATFLGLTERASDRILVANSNRCAVDIVARDSLRTVRGTDFDRLTTDELRCISDWIQGSPIRGSQAIPRPHQTRAVNDIVTELRTNSRATAVMACGSGKTLVALWVAEQLGPQTVLVLEPSLALLSQALGEWCKHQHWGDRFEYLCVCSDATVARSVDEWSLRPGEMPFPVDTDPATVRRFLSSPQRDSLRVVFATYQSAHAVAKGMPEGTAFHFGVFDEAHKTAGFKTKAHSFALNDTNLAISRRLFLTATPKTCDTHHRDEDGNCVVASMDDITVYGRTAHTLTFADAVSQGLICDYRVVVSTVDRSEVSAEALRYGITLLDEDKQTTQTVANRIAVQKAIELTGATKVITFHNRVEQAKAFAEDGPLGIGRHLPAFTVHHVNGADPISVRNEALASFATDGNHLVTNARCLSEGVDLPAVDMVVFNSPRKSKIDIVQAVGRAVRRPPQGNKAVGYILVPILLASTKANDLETACHNTEWQDVIDVLSALRDHDTRLEDVIRLRCQDKGYGRDAVAREELERVQVISTDVALEKLEQHIATVIVKEIGSTWDVLYGKLLAFKSRMGHCQPRRHKKQDAVLSQWLSRVRRKLRQGTLSAEWKVRLDAIGVVWDPVDSRWEESYQKMAEFKNENGHLRFPQYGKYSRVRVWALKQKAAYHAGVLSPARFEKLDRLGFCWGSEAEARWDAQLKTLAELISKNGHSRVAGADEDSKELRAWISVQRSAWRKGTLTAERVARLEAIGFQWCPWVVDWDKRFQELQQFRQENGHCAVPTYYPSNPELAQWLHGVRAWRLSGAIAAARIMQLEAIGVEWDRLRDDISSS
jgi:predicted helicase